MCKSLTNKLKGCNLNCHEGSCKIIQGQGPKCICSPQFSGSRCEHYRCSQYCKNHGVCYISSQYSSNLSDAIPPLKCHCPSQWTGDRCEKPVDVCENRCHNGGNCTVLRIGIPQCHCKPGFVGLRCQNCQNLVCENAGFCTKENDTEYCSCQSGYRGVNCEISICGKYRKPVMSTHEWKCECPPGYNGEKCDKRTCDLNCLNGGTCKMGNKQLECVCPKNFEGRRCEKSVCNATCKNGGKCLVVNMRTICMCTAEWGGYYCEVSKLNYCSIMYAV